MGYLSCCSKKCHTSPYPCGLALSLLIKPTLLGTIYSISFEPKSIPASENPDDIGLICWFVCDAILLREASKSCMLLFSPLSIKRLPSAHRFPPLLSGLRLYRTLIFSFKSAAKNFPSLKLLQAVA